MVSSFLTNEVTIKTKLTQAMALGIMHKPIVPCRDLITVGHRDTDTQLGNFYH
jgi:hypothetical protein